MANRNPSGRRPQAQHRQESKPSQHDKRSRLTRRNCERQQTSAASVPLVGGIATLAAAMSRVLDQRMAFRLPIILAGAMLAGGRRTAASWFRCAGVQDDWDRFYEALQTIGKQTASLMLPLLSLIFQRFDSGGNGQWTLAIDDSPTKRYGRHVEAANIHHNPTPGPADGDWLYGHNWVCLALLMGHPVFGVIAVPLLSLLYVREADIARLKDRYAWEFQTKHELALDLCLKAMRALRALGSQSRFVIVFDGAYAAGPLVRPLIAAGATVVTRLRSNSKLCDLPVQRQGQRGRPRKYGRNRISLKSRAGHRRGWQVIEYASRGVTAQARYKTFLATSEIAGGAIRVVLLEHANGNWAAYMSTDTEMPVESILKTVSDRWAIEEHFHDVKEIWGAGQQQVRNVWSNLGCWNLCGWLYAMVELECWSDSSADLVDRQDRPWDNPDRRPSHRDRRRHIARKMLRETFFHDLPSIGQRPKIRDCFERLLALAA